jgi:hypothetical protein
MLNLSYYDGIDSFLKNNKDDTDLHPQKNGSFNSKLTNQRKDLVKVIKQEKYSPAMLSQKIKEDMPKLERYIKDEKYRKKLLSSLSPSQEYYEFFDIYGLEKIIQEKIGIPENATIKYEKVKCSRKCIHNHQYFYAYYWNPTTKKLRKKYIGKKLPEPFKFKITYSIE